MEQFNMVYKWPGYKMVINNYYFAFLKRKNKVWTEIISVSSNSLLFPSYKGTKFLIKKEQVYQSILNLNHGWSSHHLFNILQTDVTVADDIVGKSLIFSSL